MSIDPVDYENAREKVRNHLSRLRPPLPPQKPSPMYVPTPTPTPPSTRSYVAPPVPGTVPVHETLRRYLEDMYRVYGISVSEFQIDTASFRRLAAELGASYPTAFVSLQMTFGRVDVWPRLSVLKTSQNYKQPSSGLPIP